MSPEQEAEEREAYDDAIGADAYERELREVEERE